mgnify:CR=1 FL=1
MCDGRPGPARATGTPNLCSTHSTCPFPKAQLGTLCTSRGGGVAVDYSAGRTLPASMTRQRAGRKLWRPVLCPVAMSPVPTISHCMYVLAQALKLLCTCVMVVVGLSTSSKDPAAWDAPRRHAPVSNGHCHIARHTTQPPGSPQMAHQRSHASRATFLLYNSLLLLTIARLKSTTARLKSTASNAFRHAQRATLRHCSAACQLQLNEGRRYHVQAFAGHAPSLCGVYPLYLVVRGLL